MSDLIARLFCRLLGHAWVHAPWVPHAFCLSCGKERRGA